MTSPTKITAKTPGKPESRRARAKLALLVAFAATVAFTAWLSALGGPHDAPTGLAAVLVTLAKAGLSPCLYILAAAGFGRLLLPLFKDARSAPMLQLASGLAILLLLTHTLGITGLLTLRVAKVPVALAVDLAGCGLLFAQLLASSRRGQLGISLPGPALLAAIPATALLLVAACQPPGWLWGSEFGGFDALSYHLQLANEWFAAGRVWPVEHNVYSYLPSLIEAAFVHVHAAAPDSSASITRELGLLTGPGYGSISTQLLHAALTLVSAGLVGSLARTIATRAAVDDKAARLIGLLAGSLFVSIPWTIVVGSLAYNEMGLTLGLAGAMLACLEPGLKPVARGLLAGLFVGVACGSKATAIFFAGAPVALLLLVETRPREWPRVLLAGAGTGLIALAPWLIRNFLACSNPVFPFAADLFGHAHWTAEQLTRFKSGHTFTGSLSDRFRLLVMMDHTDPAGARHRGLMHPQFAWLFPVALLASFVGLAATRTRRITALILGGLLLQLLAWMFLTHLQSRFLVPAIVPSCCLIALAMATFASRSGTETRWRPATSLPAAALGSLLVLASAADSIFTFSRERLAHPNSALIFGTREFTGDNLATLLSSVPPSERQRLIDNASPEIFINLNADALFPRSSAGTRTGKLYLLGDSTPFYFEVPLIYHTTWDTSPLGESVRAKPDQPAEWTRALTARGITHVLINFAELSRLNHSGPGKSSWYDPAVTPDLVATWAKSLGKPLAQWAESGRYLFALPRENTP